MDEPMLHALLQRGRQGDMEAVEEVVTWLQQERIALFRRYLWEADVPERDRSHALDEVWNEVRLHLPVFRGERPGAVILFVQRICQTIARRYRQSAPEVPTSPWDLDALSAPNVRPNPERTVDLQEALGKALGQLRFREADIYILSVEGRALDEIARLAYCSVRQARRLREKAQRDIREWMTLLHLIVEWHVTPLHPTVGQQVEVWLTLWNTGYENVEGLKVTLRVEKRRLGQHVLATLPQDAQQDVRGFTPWQSQPHPQQLVVTVALGGKTQETTRQVLTEHTL